MKETEIPVEPPVPQQEPTPPPPEPEPEPWTPERVTAWNRYYDLYVTLGVLLLVFIASFTEITNSNIWPLLQEGRRMKAGGPVVTDSFTYTVPNQRWVNVPWLFELSHAVVYDLFAPANLERRPGQLASADQYAAGALVAINAAVRVLTAFLLLMLRKPGPGLWWVAVCVALALGGVFGPPTGLELGGVAGQARVGPESWGLLCLAIELVVLHKALRANRPKLVWALVPLFLFWANMHESFLVGLLILLTTSLGRLQRPAKDEPAGPSLGVMFGVLAACAGVCLANPSTFHVYPAALEPILGLFDSSRPVVLVDDLSFFGKTLQKTSMEADSQFFYRFQVAYFLVLVGLGFLSFVLNRRRFALGRFLTYVVLAVLWATFFRYGADFALVFAAVLALNGQEWYQDNFGTQGRLGRGWAVWSVGGRAVTIVVLGLFLVKGVTGYGLTAGRPPFGYTTNADLFPFEAADTLRSARIDGNVLNTSRAQGDALIWRAGKVRKTFLDSRPHLFPPGLDAEHDTIRQALRDDDETKWRPALDKYHVTAVLINPADSPITYEHLKLSPSWIEFYDDGNVVMFGRADAPEPDISYFKEHRYDATEMAYKRRRPVESTDRPPRMANAFDKKFYDRLFQSRLMQPPQPHVNAARHWLESDPRAPTVPDPAHCLLAIWEARTALARRPDDNFAFQVLVDAYRLLMLHESAILAGKTLTLDNIEQITPDYGTLNLRFMQRATALNFAIQTAPPPQSEHDRHILRALHYDLGQLYLNANMLDLARDRLQDAIDLSEPSQIPAEIYQRVGQLNEQVNQADTRLRSLDESAQVDPVQRAQAALQLGLAGIAIDELAEADQTGVRPAVVRPALLDLYCQSGQADKALDLLGSTEDSNLNSGPGTAARRQGLVSFLIGYDESAARLWNDYAIARIRGSQAAQALMSTQVFVKGEVMPATQSYLELPGRVETEGSWEFDLALALLESGEPEQAAVHFTKALELFPKIATRPIAAYYLTQFGKPVPPAPGDEEGKDAKQGPAPGKAKEEAAPKASEPGKGEEKPKAEDKSKTAEPAKGEDKPGDGQKPDTEAKPK